MAMTPNTAGIRCFGQRMLSPFRGVMHSVVTGWADAVTIDGRNWTLYVRGECLYDTLHDPAIMVPDVKYGNWSEDKGFQRAPIRMPTFDARVRDEGERLLTAVRQHAAALPFALADRFEHWLLHAATGRPLALIGSGCSERECDHALPPHWTPGQACMAELPAALHLQAVLAELAGPTPSARWFERLPDGRGVSVGTGSGDTPVLAGDCFAPLLVDRGALTDPQCDLLDAVQAWQAPALLHLPDLSRAQRQQFELAACRHARRIAEQLPLYPEVIDRQAMTAALVEARLRHANPEKHAGAPAGNALGPFYLEVPD